jgi:hypothetical protein
MQVAPTFARSQHSMVGAQLISLAAEDDRLAGKD